MSMSARTVVRSERAPSTAFLGFDGHKESVTIAVLPSDAAVPTHVDTLADDLKKLRRYLERPGTAATRQACYGAWRIVSTVIAPSLIPTTPGVQRTHDTYDASQLAHRVRAGERTAVHVPTEADASVRDLVRCRSTFPQEILKSRHYVLEFAWKAQHRAARRDSL